MSVSLKNIGGLQSIVSYSVAAGAPPPFNTKSLELDGTGDALDPQFSEATLQTMLRGSHTYSIWVKANWDTSFTMIGYNDTGSFVVGGIKLNYTYFNAFVDAISVSGKSGGSNWSTTTLVNHASTADATEWVHFCIVQTKGAGASDAGSYRLFINGSPATAAIATPNRTFQEATEVSTGRGLLFGANDNNGSPVEHMIGKIDQIAIWLVPLDAEAVAAIYNSGVPIDLTTDSGDYDNSNRLKYYYKLEDNAIDTKGNSNGSTIGDPAFSTDIPS